MKRNKLVAQEKRRIREQAQLNRKKIEKLSPNFEYDSYYYGCARITGFSPTFEDYLEISSKLPENELVSYDLYYYKATNDSLQITHKVVIDDEGNNIQYTFIVGDVERTLEKLTEGKCKIVEKVQKTQESKYTALSCNL